MSMKDLDVIWDKIDTPKPGDGGCWNWIKSTCTAGYGQLRVNGVDWLAHRYVAWAIKGLKKDSGLLVRHMCHNPRCCNPNHLLLGSSKDNYHDSIDKYKAVAKAKAFGWIINGVDYQSQKKAWKVLGIGVSALIKYTDPKTRVFDIEAYREGCRRGNKKPRI